MDIYYIKKWIFYHIGNSKTAIHWTTDICQVLFGCNGWIIKKWKIPAPQQEYK